MEPDANQRVIFVKGENLLFLREPVSVTTSKGQEPWTIRRQSDSFLMIYDLHFLRDSGQALKESENAISMISIKTAFGEIHQPIQPPEVCPSFLRARIIMCPLTGVCACVYLYMDVLLTLPTSLDLIPLNIFPLTCIYVNYKMFRSSGSTNNQFNTDSDVEG